MGTCLIFLCHRSCNLHGLRRDHTLTNKQMARNRRNLRESDPNSPGDSEAESSGEKSPIGNDSRSRRNGKSSDEVEVRR